MMETRRTRLASLAETLGTPSYVYFLDEVRANIVRLRDAFDGAFEVSYAVKANPAHAVLAALRGQVEALDVSSGGEIARAIAADWDASKISFTGPGKREAELRAAIDARIGEVVLESPEEARQLSAIAEGAGLRQQVLVRISPARVPPGFGDTMSGKPGAFGIDEEDLPAFLDFLQGLPGLKLVGFHAYSGTQCLDPNSIVENWRIFAGLFVSASAAAGIQPKRLVFGSGLGIRYHDKQEALDLAVVAAKAAPVIAELREACPRATLALETGRFLIGEAGVLLTRVLRTKDSRGTRIGICDSGLNHHLAAAGLFGMLMRRNYRMSNVSAPPGEAVGGPYQLSGPLCTSIDVLARNASFPRLEAGDVIAIESSGAYGPTASPSAFISHPPAQEWVVDGNMLRNAQDGSLFPMPQERGEA
jgi:diaminopimelate decarboxylase